MRMTSIHFFALFLAAFEMATACKHAPFVGRSVSASPQAALRDLVAPGVDGAPARVVFEDKGKVHVRGCPASAVIPVSGTLSASHCDIDLHIQPIPAPTYRERLAKALGVRPPDVVLRTELEVEKVDFDFGRLQSRQLDIHHSGRVDDASLAPQIDRAGARGLELRAKLVTTRSRNAQFARIISGLRSTSAKRFFAPGIDQKVAMAPFEAPAQRVNIIGPGSCVKRNSIGMLFCDIPAGSFVMGAPPAPPSRPANPEEQPPHLVTLTGAFEMMATEVTQGMWLAIMGRNMSRFVAAGNPVERVTYEEITGEFLPRLNERLASEGYRYRLPTEAEWEFACRAGKDGDFGIDGDPGEFSWNTANSERESSRVGLLRPNAFGLFDMHGNVREMVFDAFTPYDPDPVSDPVVSNGDGQTSRGGGWRDPDLAGRCAARGLLLPGVPDENTGFRLVRSRH